MVCRERCKSISRKPHGSLEGTVASIFSCERYNLAYRKPHESLEAIVASIISRGLCDSITG